MGSSVLILLVCLCINYPELRTLPGRGAARSRITGFIITCCRLLITENYERSAGVGWVVMADGTGTVDEGEGDGRMLGRKATPLRFVFSINFRKLRTIVRRD